MCKAQGGRSNCYSRTAVLELGVMDKSNVIACVIVLALNQTKEENLKLILVIFFLKLDIVQWLDVDIKRIAYYASASLW